MQYTYKHDTSKGNDKWIPREEINVGDKVLVYSLENLMTGETEYRLSVQFAESGMPGNMDSNEKAFHGWRGTTNNIRTEAHGVYRIAEIKEESYRDKNGWKQYRTKVVLDKRDLASERK